MLFPVLGCPGRVSSRERPVPGLEWWASGPEPEGPVWIVRGLLLPQPAASLRRECRSAGGFGMPRLHGGTTASQGRVRVWNGQACRRRSSSVSSSLTRASRSSYRTMCCPVSGSCQPSCPWSHWMSRLSVLLYPCRTPSPTVSMGTGSYPPSARRSPARRVPWNSPVSSNRVGVKGDEQVWCHPFRRRSSWSPGEVPLAGHQGGFGAAQVLGQVVGAAADGEVVEAGHALRLALRGVREHEAFPAFLIGCLWMWGGHVGPLRSGCSGSGLLSGVPGILAECSLLWKRGLLPAWRPQNGTGRYTGSGPS